MELQSDTGSLAHGLLQDPGAVPLVIAVAGHRDPRLEFLPLLRQNFRIQLESLIRTLPHTPLLMLNGLAEGMDSETAQMFLDQGAAKVAILDVDFHHGNGTQDIFYERDDVLFCSMHGAPEDAFPFFLGYGDETGAGRGSCGARAGPRLDQRRQRSPWRR